jgi:hypothetical protein
MACVICQTLVHLYTLYSKAELIDTLEDVMIVNYYSRRYESTAYALFVNNVVVCIVICHKVQI